MITMLRDGKRRKPEAFEDQPTKAELEHDRAVRAEVKQLSALAAKVDEFRVAMEAAKKNYDEAATPKAQAETKLARHIAMGNFDRAMRAKADAKRLTDQNPRAFGRPWLRPADLFLNQRLESERVGLKARLAAVEAQIKAPYPPV